MKRLKTQTNQHFIDLIDLLKSYDHLSDQESLHKIRVEIKKLKTILSLINFCTPQFKKHQHFVPVREIFRKAGEIRQPEVFYKLLLLYQISGVYDSYIPKSTKIDTLSLTFEKNVPRFMIVVKKLKKELKKYYARVEKINVEKYTRIMRRKVKRLLLPSFNIQKLHRVRKISKEIVHLNTLDEEQKLNHFFMEVENLIGIWHDKKMLLPVVRKTKNVDDINKLKAACKIDLIKLKEMVGSHYTK